MEGEEEEKFLTTLNTDVRMKRTKKKKEKGRKGENTREENELASFLQRREIARINNS